MVGRVGRLGLFATRLLTLFLCVCAPSTFLFASKCPPNAVGRFARKRQPRCFSILEFAERQRVLAERTSLPAWPRMAPFLSPPFRFALTHPRIGRARAGWPSTRIIHSTPRRRACEGRPCTPSGARAGATRLGAPVGSTRRRPHRPCALVLFIVLSRLCMVVSIIAGVSPFRLQSKQKKKKKQQSKEGKRPSWRSPCACARSSCRFEERTVGRVGPRR